MAGLIKALSGAHGGRRGKTEASVGFDLKCGSGEWYGVGFSSLSFIDGRNGVASVFEGVK